MLNHEQMTLVCAQTKTPPPSSAFAVEEHSLPEQQGFIFYVF